MQINCSQIFTKVDTLLIKGGIYWYWNGMNSEWHFWGATDIELLLLCPLFILYCLFFTQGANLLQTRLHLLIYYYSTFVIGVVIARHDFLNAMFRYIGTKCTD